MSPKKKVNPLPEVKISDYIDPAVASGVAVICPHCKLVTLNTRFCIICGSQLHALGWTPPVPLYESFTG